LTLPLPLPAHLHLHHIDDALLVVEKPAGLLSVPGRGPDKQDCLSTRVQQLYPEALVVHRLDMGTSGLLLMARNAEVQRKLSQAFADRQIHKRYVAVIHGLLPEPQTPGDSWQLIDLPIAVDWPRRPLRVIDPVHGKASQTRWRVISRDVEHQSTRLLLEPLTGRSHQLRVHLLALGHPIKGDALYQTDSFTGFTALTAPAAHTDRLLLHASALGFSHPVSGQWIDIESPAPF
jgi:tRNA pseudouridine32 synthase/23S rRNA pseudouridine746 synthase